MCTLTQVLMNLQYVVKHLFALNLEIIYIFKYTEKQDCREECAIADLHTQVIIILFQYNRSRTKLGWSEA